MRPDFRVAAALAVGSLILAGCSQSTIKSAETDTHNNLATAKAETNSIEARIDPDAQKLGLGARVTAALCANSNLPRTIRVDASPNAVRLKGAVQTQAQKTLAGQVAQETVPTGDTVTNAITVNGSAH